MKPVREQRASRTSNFEKPLRNAFDRDLSLKVTLLEYFSGIAASWYANLSTSHLCHASKAATTSFVITLNLFRCLKRLISLIEPMNKSMYRVSRESKTQVSLKTEELMVELS